MPPPRDQIGLTHHLTVKYLNFIFELFVNVLSIKVLNTLGYRDLVIYSMHVMMLPIYKRTMYGEEYQDCSVNFTNIINQSPSHDSHPLPPLPTSAV